MPNGRNVFPPSDLPPDMQSWGRSVEGDIRRNQDDIDSLRANTIADYKQLNAATTAASNQVASLRNYLYSIPGTNVQSISVNNISLAAGTWTDIVATNIPIPGNRNKVTVLTSLTFAITTPEAETTSVWYYLYSGSDPAIESPANSSTGYPASNPVLTNFYTAQASGSTSYVFPNRAGGFAEIRARLWSSSARTFGGSFILTYNLISGGAL